MWEEGECLTVSVDTAAKIIGIGRQTAYEGVRSVTIPSIRFGRKIRVPKAALNRMLVESQTDRS